jgi:hypothetical protein
VTSADKRPANAGRGLIACALMFLAPPLMTTAYLWLSRTHDLWSWQRGTSDYLALAASVGVGLVGVFVLPTGRIRRAVIAVVYAPVTACLLIIWALMFVCGAFGACL